MLFLCCNVIVGELTPFVVHTIPYMCTYRSKHAGFFAIGVFLVLSASPRQRRSGWYTTGCAAGGAIQPRQPSS